MGKSYSFLAFEGKGRITFQHLTELESLSSGELNQLTEPSAANPAETSSLSGEAEGCIVPSAFIKPSELAPHILHKEK